MKHSDINVKSLNIQNPDDNMVVNAFEKGNVARFANHRCGGTHRGYNMTSQFVYRSSHSDKHFYLALVTRECVPAGREMTWDYGYDSEGLKKFLKCLCQTESCPNGV